MGEYDDVDLDRMTARAWARFRVDLGDRLAHMVDDDVLVVEVESEVDEDDDGAAPYVQFCGWGGDLVRAEVSSNAYLAEEVLLDAPAERALERLGWLAPTYEPGHEADDGSENFHLDLPRRECDRLAAMAVGALRDVFGVPHPAFLSGLGPSGSGRPSAPGGEPEVGLADEEPLAVTPDSPEHLRALVAAALTPPGGPDIEFDDEGDIPLPMGSALLFVRVSEEAPVVEIFAVVVRGSLDRERAAFEVAVLNRDTRMVKFVLLDDAVLALLQLPAGPFVPRHLRSMVLAMADIVDRVDDDLVARVGGRRGLDAEPAADDGGPAGGGAGSDEAVVADEVDAPDDPDEERTLHPALQTLLELDPHGEGDLDPDLAASVCAYDRDLVLRLIKVASRQELTWRRSAETCLVRGEHEEAEVCFGESRGWEVSVETLRAALRVIVERERREKADRPGRRAARRRPVQQSLLDDAAVRRDVTGEDTLFGPESRE